MENSESKRRKVVNKKNDLLTKLQKKIKKKIKKNVKSSGKRNEELNGNRQCIKNGVPERTRLRVKGAPGHEGMFLKGLRTKYIRRKTLNEANEARKNEDINKIIDIGRVFQKRKQEGGRRKRAFNLHSATKNQKSQKILEEDLTVTSEDFIRCSLSAISTVETYARPVFNTDATIILQENNTQQVDRNTITEKKKLNLDKKLVMFSLLYEEKVGSQLLPRLTEHDVLEQAFRALRNQNKKFMEDEALENEFVKEFKFLTENSEPEIPLAEIFGEDFHHRNQARVTGNQSSDICVRFTEAPIDDSIRLCENLGICEIDPLLTPSFGEKQHRDTEIQTKDFETHRPVLNITTPQIQFYRRNMF